MANEVRYWGEWVLKKVKAEIGDLYPLIPDPAYHADRKNQKNVLGTKDEIPPGYLVPVAYLWTRTVTCKNPTCTATVPLARQTWMRKKKGDVVALKGEPERSTKRVRFSVFHSTSEKGLGFDPAIGSNGGNATCPFCGTVADTQYVKEQGMAGRLGHQLMATACSKTSVRGKIYIPVDSGTLDENQIRIRIQSICDQQGLSIPREPIVNDAKKALFCVLYGLVEWGHLFSPRQMLCLMEFTAAIRRAEAEIRNVTELDRSTAVTVLLAAMLDRLADFSSTICVWNSMEGERTAHTFGRQALPMTWDYSEAAPFNEANAGWPTALERVIPAIESVDFTNTGTVARGSATRLPWEDESFDAIVTDPPYYDNVPYADISDFFYVWLKRTIGHLFPEHFSGQGTPKKQEAVADATRHGGDRKKAVAAYEEMMANSLAEAHRALKPGGTLAVVYAHKTTLGWSTLVDAFRHSGFVVTEAWPLDTEKPGRLRAQESAALASSIFLVGRNREGTATGSYEIEVQPELQAVVRERVDTLWELGISGADLVIACVGAGLRAFTRFGRVEYANGEEVPAERFLTEVETVVLDSILRRLSKEVGGNGGKTSLAGVDPATRFYTLWRYTYRGADLEAGEAIIFANGTHIELDGPSGVSAGSKALVEKKKGKYRLRDYRERGDDDRIGLPTDDGQAAPLIDALRRTLWLMENRPLKLAEYLREAEPNRDQMRLVAQALAGPALKGGEMPDISPTGELAALAKLTANWRSVVEDNAVTQTEQADRKRGQKTLFE